MRLMNENDMDLIRSVFDIKVSPDGGILAFLTENTCTEENRSQSFLCSYELGSGTMRRVTDDDRVRNFCFDKDGMLLYTCDSGEESTVFWKADPITGSVARAFTLPVGDAKLNLIWNDSFVVSAPWDLELEKLRSAGDEQAVRAHLNKEVIVCDEYPYRIDGQGYIGKLRNRIYTYDVRDGSFTAITPATFQTRDLSADGGRLYLLGEDYDVKTTEKSSVYCFDGTRFALLAGCGHMLSALAVSDGRIYAATDMLPDEMDSYIYSAEEGGRMEVLFKTRHSLFNNISTDITGSRGCEFLAAGGKLYFTMQNRKGVCLYAWENGKETRVSPEGLDIFHFAVSKDGRVFAAALPGQGGIEVFEVYPDRAVQLTRLNEELEQFDFTEPEHLIFKSSDGEEIDGWVVPPAGYRPGRKYPAILNIHGGPQLRYYGGLNFTHQLWAARGYFVMYCNPHGSIGDTAAFSDLRKRYGTIDYEDIQTFVDTVLEKYPSIDEKRMGVTGISYGGFMTNWIITRSDRFAAAASQSGISDWISLHATDDLPGFDLTITGSLPWEDISEHWRISPLAYAGACHTPTLFIECGEDYRCTVDQGLGMYQALLTLGVPSRAVIVNGETHCVFRLGKPRSRLRIYHEIMDWFERYIPKEVEYDSICG